MSVKSAKTSEGGEGYRRPSVSGNFKSLHPTSLESRFMPHRPLTPLSDLDRAYSVTLVYGVKKPPGREEDREFIVWRGAPEGCVRSGIPHSELCE
jgi:hypothetical protein